MPGRSCRIMARRCSPDTRFLLRSGSWGSASSEAVPVIRLSEARGSTLRWVQPKCPVESALSPSGLTLKREQAGASRTGRGELLPLALLDPLAATTLEERHGRADQTGEEREQEEPLLAALLLFVLASHPCSFRGGPGWT